MNYKRYVVTFIFLVTGGVGLSQAWAQTEGTSVEQTEPSYRERAGLFVEPAVKYESLSTTVEYPAPFRESDQTLQGPGVSARIGGHVGDVVFLALEGNYSRLSSTESGTNYAADGAAYSWGPVLGVQTPWAGIRVWGTYLADGQYDPASNNNVDLKFTDLRGYRVGLGLRVAVVGISLEYQNAAYNTTEVSSPLFDTVTNSVNARTDGWIAGVNFPISL